MAVRLRDRADVDVIADMVAGLLTANHQDDRALAGELAGAVLDRLPPEKG